VKGIPNPQSFPLLALPSVGEHGARRLLERPNLATYVGRPLVQPLVCAVGARRLKSPPLSPAINMSRRGPGGGMPKPHRTPIRSAISMRSRGPEARIPETTYVGRPLSSAISMSGRGPAARMPVYIYAGPPTLISSVISMSRRGRRLESPNLHT
jgi:hypothetical protein